MPSHPAGAARRRPRRAACRGPRWPLASSVRTPSWWCGCRSTRGLGARPSGRCPRRPRCGSMPKTSAAADGDHAARPVAHVLDDGAGADAVGRGGNLDDGPRVVHVDPRRHGEADAATEPTRRATGRSAGAPDLELRRPVVQVRPQLGGGPSGGAARSGRCRGDGRSRRPSLPAPSRTAARTVPGTACPAAGWSARLDPARSSGTFGYTSRPRSATAELTPTPP